MGKKYYAVRYANGHGEIFTTLQAFQRAIRKSGVALHKGFLTPVEAEQWLKDPEGFPREKKIYAVKAGKVPGIYKNVEDYNAQVKGYPNSMGMVFFTVEGAEYWLKDAEGALPQPLGEESLWGKVTDFMRGLILPVVVGVRKKWQLRNLLQEMSHERNSWVFCRLNTDHDLLIYTDASFRERRGAGYAAAIIDKVSGAEFYVGGNSKEIGNSSRAELYAIISAQQVIEADCKAAVEIRTDAHSLVQVAKPKNLRKLKERGWNSRDCANMDLWQEYYKYTLQRNIVITWVRGHSGNAYNSRCDRIAGMCSR